MRASPSALDWTDLVAVIAYQWGSMTKGKPMPEDVKASFRVDWWCEARNDNIKNLIQDWPW
jgi:hypothetical protein